MPNLKVLIVFIALFTGNLSSQEKDEIVWVKNEDPVMLDAISEARSKLDDFLKLSANPEDGMSEFKLKVRVSDEFGSEHFWVLPFKNNNSNFTGVLANQPKVVKSVTVGEEITFNRADISDWGYIHNGKQVGSFTVCALFKSMPKNQVEYYRVNYGFQC